MTRYAFLFALAALVAVGGCDSPTGPGEEEEEEEDLGPISLEYRIDAPNDAIKFVIRYTNADGETVQEPIVQPFAFPFVPEIIELPSDAAGTFAISFAGTVPGGQGSIRTTVVARQNGLRIAGDSDSDTATAADPAVSARSEIVLPVD